MTRPGRLDRILYVGPPDRIGREEILKIRTAQMTIGPGVDFAELAEMVRRRSFQAVDHRVLTWNCCGVFQTEGCSGAELTAMCQDAALLAMRENIHAPHVSRNHFLAAAAGVRRQITRSIVQKFIDWRVNSGLNDA